MKHLLTLFLFIICYNGFSEKIDTTIFNTEFEKNIFTKYLNNENIDPTDLFISLNYEEDYQDIKKRIDSFVKNLNSPSFVKSNLKTKLKTIYKSVHLEFFRKYIENTSFIGIFYKGEYNCVGATALYSIILNKLNISYNIKETPNHVYLIADPGNTEFIFETTLPSNGIYTLDNRTKSNYVEYLHNNKMISDSEFEKQSVDDLFNKYYLTDSTINIYELAGLQYYNKAIEMVDKKSYTSALKYIEKAEILHKTNYTDYIKYVILANIFNEEMATNDYKGKNLAKFINLNYDNLIASQYGRDFFSQVSNYFIVEHPNLQSYKNYYNDFITFAEDTLDYSEINKTFYTYISNYYYSTNDFYNTLQNLDKAYKINPENIRTKELITLSTYKLIFDGNNYLSKIDSIHKYMEIYPFLNNDKPIQQYHIVCYLVLAGQEVANKKFEKGEEILNNLTDIVKINQNLELEYNLIANLYSEISSYYVRKQKYKKAEDILKKGLIVAPDSYELKHKLDLLKNSSR